MVGYHTTETEVPQTPERVIIPHQPPLQPVEGLLFPNETLAFHPVTWEMVESDSIELAGRIEKAGIRFDSLVGIEKGGLFNFALLADLLAIKEIGTLRIIRSDEEEMGELHPPTLVKPVNIDVAGKRVLLVDDIIDEGPSMLIAQRHLAERGALTIVTATPYIKPSALEVLTLDFGIWVTRSWVLFPFDIRENIEKLTHRWSVQQKLYEETVLKRLRELGLSEKAIKKFAPELF